jgi:hypothetical protein
MRPFKESDDDYRRRIAAKYGMYLNSVADATGEQLDAIGALLDVKRIETLVPAQFEPESLPDDGCAECAETPGGCAGVLGH